MAEKIKPPFKSEKDFREHMELHYGLNSYINEAMLRVCPFWTDKYEVIEWWENPYAPKRLVITYDSHEGCESYDNQTVTAVEILWDDNLEEAHNRVLEELRIEEEKRREEAKKNIKTYRLVVEETEEEERAHLRKLADKYPDELKEMK